MVFQISDIKIVNVVITAKIVGNFNLTTIERKILNAKYESVFNGIKIKEVNIKSTIILFSSGNITIYGNKSENLAKSLLYKTLKKIKKINGIIGSDCIKKLDIINVVGVGKLSDDIDLEKISRNGTNIIYEPEQFPGIIFRPYNNQIVSTIFASGKITIVGGKNELQIKKAFNDITKFINNLYS